MNSRLRYAGIAFIISLTFSTHGFADLILSYSGFLSDTGETTFSDFAELGYDIYGVVSPSTGFSGSTNTSTFRRLQLPSFVDGITLNANSVYWGAPEYPLADIPDEGLRRVGVLSNVRPESQGGLGEWRSLLTFTVNGSIPDFRVGVVSPSGIGPYHHVDALRFTSLIDGSSVTATIDPSARGNSLDIAFFDFLNAADGDTFLLQGREDDPKPNGYNNVIISGLTFQSSSANATVPEPSTLALFTIGILTGCVSRALRRRRSPFSTRFV